MPNLDSILLNPDSAPVPEEASARFAVTVGLARKATQANIERLMRYLKRLPKEFEVCCVRDAIRLTPAVQQTRAFVDWSVRNASVLL